MPEILSDWYLDALYPKEGMDLVQKDLLDRGIRLYILSNTGFTFHKFCYKIRYYDRFSGQILSCEERLMKPDPAIYRRLCDRFSLEPSECLFIDDLPATSGARRASACRAIASRTATRRGYVRISPASTPEQIAFLRTA